MTKHFCILDFDKAPEPAKTGIRRTHSRKINIALTFCNSEGKGEVFSVSHPGSLPEVIQMPLAKIYPQMYL